MGCDMGRKIRLPDGASRICDALERIRLGSEYKKRYPQSVSDKIFLESMTDFEKEIVCRAFIGLRW